MLERFLQESDKTIWRPGERLDIQRRSKNRSDKWTKRGRSIRTSIDKRLKNGYIAPANDNITTGTMLGAIGTVIVWTLEDYLPGRVGANTEVVDVEWEGGNTVTYTVDCNAPIESHARFRSMLDSTTGISSLWTDDIEVISVDVVNERVGRDTYRYEITVRD